MAKTKENEASNETQQALISEMITPAASSREILGLGLTINRTQIEGIRAVHRLVEDTAFNLEALSRNEFPPIRTTASVVTDLHLAIITSPLIIDMLLDEQEDENGSLPSNVRIETDADEGDERTDPTRCVVIVTAAGSCLVTEEEGPLTMNERFIKLNSKRGGDLVKFTDKMNHILDKLGAEEPMVLSSLKGMGDDEMTSSPAGQAALLTAESTEARRATERRETLMQNFIGGIEKLTEVLGHKKNGGQIINYTTHPQLGEYINSSHQSALNNTITLSDI